ncbi:major facilitator superfamily domain-containing protein [Thermoascus aurantiacus ATCC 26904]
MAAETVNNMAKDEKTFADAALEAASDLAISHEHREYVVRRHGTLQLDPIPSADPADPLNWPSWKKHANLFLVAFHAMMTTFIASGVIPAYVEFSKLFNISLQKASYFTSAQILFLGLAPFFWKPVSNRFGRRPVWLVSTLCSMVCNIGCAESKSYGAMMVCRILVAIFISPPVGIGSGVVTETFFQHERGQKMGIWTLLVTLGPPAGPFIMGFVTYHLGWRWVYWTFAIINGAQFVGYLFFGPETRYLGPRPPGMTAFQAEYLRVRRIDPTPFTLRDFYQPLLLARYRSIVVPAVSYAIVFGFCSVLLTVEIPQLFGLKFEFNAQEIGLQFLSVIIGTVLGEQFGGPFSDFFMKRRTRALGGQRPAPEFRLWSSYLGFACVVVGLVVFCVQLDRAVPLHWNVTPLVGIAIAAFGNQIVTTVLITYAIDCHHEHSASIGVFIGLVRQLWGFIGPFWFPDMFTTLGLGGSAGLCAGLVVAVSVLPIALLQWVGGSKSIE